MKLCAVSNFEMKIPAKVLIHPLLSLLGNASALSLIEGPEGTGGEAENGLCEGVLNNGDKIIKNEKVKKMVHVKGTCKRSTFKVL